MAGATEKNDFCLHDNHEGNQMHDVFSLPPHRMP